MPLGRRLYRKRLERGLTQTDLARQVRVPQSLISRLEAGIKDYPSVEVLNRLETEVFGGPRTARAAGSPSRCSR